jgi:hypothetical protein
LGAIDLSIFRINPTTFDHTIKQARSRSVALLLQGGGSRRPRLLS